MNNYFDRCLSDSCGDETPECRLYSEKKHPNENIYLWRTQFFAIIERRTVQNLGKTTLSINLLRVLTGNLACESASHTLVSFLFKIN